VPINVTSIPTGQEGFLFFKFCTQDNGGGVCDGQILYFNF
jgi:hypothetical protein